MSTFTIGNFNVRTDDNLRTLGAVVDGEELYVTLPAEIDVVPRAELFLGVALMPAMHAKRDIEISDDMPVSPKLLRNLERIQRLLRQWSPVLNLIEVRARVEAPVVRNDIVSSSFSGGVDSSCTLARHEHEITHLMMATGFDVKGSDVEDDDKQVQFEALSRKLGKTPLFIRSNLRAFSERRRVHWTLSHGSVMASLMAGLCVRKHYLPSSYTYRELKPWGSHPLLDDLWSTEATELVHDATELRRSEKTELIAEHPLLLEQLQVCWRSGIENCGVCSKCVRTRLVLEILGKKGPFPDVPFDIQSLSPHADLSAAFVWDLRQFALEHGRPDIASRMQKILARYLRKRSFDSLARAIVGSAGERLYRKYRPGSWEGKVHFPDPDQFK